MAAFDPIYAVDPNNSQNVAENGVISIYAPNTRDLLTIKTVTGSPLSNPLQLNARGFGPAFIADGYTLVAWEAVAPGEVFQGTFKSYEGVLEQAVAAKGEAAEGAATELASRIAAGEFNGIDGLPGRDGSNVIPTAEAIAAEIETPGTPANTALSATYGTVQGFQSQADRSRYIPQFRKVSAQPVFTRSQQTALTSIYWFWGQRVDEFLAAPLDKYYFWYSTNHDATAGGIALVTAPTPTGPFTNRGKVFTDTTTGNQTETPSVLWNEAESLFFMYYQQKLTSAPQATLLATSPDGINWTRVGIVLGGVNTSSVLGSADETYFQPFRVGERWAGYHLMGGGNYGRFGISYSNDGRNWQRDPRALSSGLEWSAATGGRVLSWNGSTVVSYKGRLWWVGLLANRVSSADVKNNRIGIAPISTDLRRLTAPPQQILPMTDYPWESSDLQSLTFMSDGPSLYLYYQCGTENIGCAVLEG